MGILRPEGEHMAGKRKRPQLWFDGTYYRLPIYKPDGKRTTISFGSIQERKESEIRIAAERWLDLYEQHPHKVLGFKDPYEAIEQIINPVNVTSVGDFLEKYERHFRKTVKPTRQGRIHPDLTFVGRVQDFLRPYADWSVDSFGPDELLELQRSLADYTYTQGHAKKQYVRRTINDTINWIRRIWEWGEGRGIVKHQTNVALQEIRPLAMGDEGTIDKSKRVKVSKEELLKVVDSVNSVVGDMLKLIWYTGMRPYEVCEMRPYDILRDDPECWLYIPGRDKTPVGKHKTTKYEKVKVIPLAGNSQEILKPRIIDVTSKQFVFSPEDAIQETRLKRHSSRRTPLCCGNSPGTNRKQHPMIKPGKCYKSSSLRRACERGCIRAGVETFVPYDLRRTAATETRALLGKEDAQTLLGHVKKSTTEIYLLEEVQEAMKVAKRLSEDR